MEFRLGITDLILHLLCGLGNSWQLLAMICIIQIMIWISSGHPNLRQIRSDPDHDLDQLRSSSICAEHCHILPYDIAVLYYSYMA
jgi:hypothetical protein